MEGDGADVFDLIDFDFMPMGTELVGERTQDTPQSEPLGEYWNQLPPLLQGPLGIPLHKHKICQK